MTYQILETYPVNALTRPAQPGFRNRGFPAGGPADQPLAQIARALTGNPEAELYEISARFRLLATAPCLIGIASRLEEFSVNDQPHHGCERICLQPQDELTISAPKRSARLYLAITSTNQSQQNFRLAELFDQDHTVIYWIPGAKTERQEIQAQVTEASLTGIRLDAGLPGRPALNLSEPSVPGVIQTTPDGTLLIHGVQGPTIGGYHRAGAVIAADLWKLAQLRPGNNIHLAPVNLKQAQNHLQVHLKYTKNTLQTTANTTRLFDQNTLSK